MKKKFIKALSNSSIIRSFIAKPSPKWMVYLADLVIIAISCGLTLAFGFHNTYGDGFFYSPAARAILNSSHMPYWLLSSARAATSSACR